MLNRWFAPAVVRRLEPLVLSRCVELIEELRPRGGCDLVSDFAIRFPTDLFLATLNLPISDGNAFLYHVENVFKGFAGRELEQAATSTAWIRDYFDRAIAEREHAPRDTQVDFISRLLVSELDGAPIPRDDIITICYTAMLAGLDTTRSALGFIFHHLAGHTELRHRLTARPELWPKAVEEFIRLYPLVFMDGRLVTRDIDFHGLHMHKGEIVWLGLARANCPIRRSSPSPAASTSTGKARNTAVQHGIGSRARRSASRSVRCRAEFVPRASNTALMAVRPCTSGDAVRALVAWGDAGRSRLRQSTRQRKPRGPPRVPAGNEGRYQGPVRPSLGRPPRAGG